MFAVDIEEAAERLERRDESQSRADASRVQRSGADVATRVAELRTPDGVFLIQDRRVQRRDGAPSEAPRKTARASIATSPGMMGLSGLIIIGVLVGSFTTKFDAAIGHMGGALPVPAVGFLALQLFLARNAFRLYEEVGDYSHLGDFILNRALRYLPATLPAVLIGFVLLKVFGLPGFKAEIANLPANLLLVADMLGVPEIDSAHWRLKIEILQAALVAMAWFGPSRRYLAMLLTVALAVTAVFANGEPVREHVLTLRGVLTLDGYLPFFTFGIALCELERNRGARVWQAMLVASAFLAYRSNTPVHGLVVVAGLAVLAALAFGRLTMIGRFGWLNRLGAIAFPVYVVHYVLGFLLIHRLERLGCPALLAILVASALVLLAGEALHRVFERPMQKHGPAAVKSAIAAARRWAATSRDRLTATGV